jgi:hypothetical protein
MSRLSPLLIIGRARMLHVEILLVSAVLMCSMAIAQPLVPELFEESLNPEVKVSGATRGGILMGAISKPESLETLTVRLSAVDFNTHLCVQVVTRDGRYEARMEFTLNDDVNEYVELIFPSKFKQQLRAANEPYLAVLASLRSGCSDGEIVYLPVAWAEPASLTALEIVVNAGNLDAHVAVPLRDGGERTFACERIETSPTIAFNRTCTIELDSELDLMRTQIRRDDFFGNPLPPIALPIAF